MYFVTLFVVTSCAPCYGQRGLWVSTAFSEFRQLRYFLKETQEDQRGSNPILAFKPSDDNATNPQRTSWQTAPEQLTKKTLSLSGQRKIRRLDTTHQMTARNLGKRVPTAHTQPRISRKMPILRKCPAIFGRPCGASTTRRQWQEPFPFPLRGGTQC